jgi:hypothetical protein
VRTALFALLLLGCKEEPTIVIKFEPNDLAAKAAAAKLEPDAGAVKAADPVGTDCKVAADCAAVDEECCTCAQGGKQVAVAASAAAAYRKKSAAKCKDVMCTAMMSNDPSCAKVPDCVAGKCVLGEPRKPAPKKK